MIRAARMTSRTKDLFKILNEAGGLLGYVEKYPDTATETFPWAAYGLDYSPPPVGGSRTAPGRGKFLGNFDSRTLAMKKVEETSY